MNKKGFTLIELLGVIILIAIISLLAFPSILNHIKKAQDTIDKTTKNLVITAAKNYVSDNLNYFPKVEGNVFCLTTSELLSKKYLDKTIIEENETLEDKLPTSTAIRRDDINTAAQRILWAILRITLPPGSR